MYYSNNKTVDKLYYNINLVNKQDGEAPLTFEDNRNQNILENVDKYELSILRFSIDLSAVPLIKFPTRASTLFLSEDYNELDENYWSITLDDGNGAIDQQFVKYVSYGNSAARIENFYHFVDLLNIAIKQAADALGINTRVPYFTYERELASISLVLPIEYKESVNNNRKFYINKNLYDSFGSDFKGYKVDQSNGRYYQILAEGTGDNVITSQLVEANGFAINSLASPSLIMRTFYPNLGKLIVLRQIVFTTNMPIIAELESSNLTDSTSFGFTQVMKDFDLSIEDKNAILTKGIQNFSISSEFQMIQLKGGSNALDSISLRAFWRDNHGYIYPLNLPRGGAFSMKLLFQRKK